MRDLVLITYNIKEPEDKEEFNKVIREKDYPAFRQNPYITQYSCFEIVENVQGEEWFRRFDLMFIKDAEHHPDDIWNDPTLKEHSDWFVPRWLADNPDGPDYKLSRAREIWG
jgi:hypothetical protein